MKSEALLAREFSVTPTVLKLVFLGGTMITVVYGLLEAMAGAIKMIS